MNNIYATCVSLNKKGILLLGKSGSGKSDLALRLIEQCGAVLVADDRTNLFVKNGELCASCPDNIKGLLEVRGVGIVKKKHLINTKIKLVAELSEKEEQIERLPTKEYTDIEGIKIRKIKVYPFEISAAYKVKLVCDELE
ncbi:MAG: HPr kinase/phosphatase C-terminal domain-containing protein [Alphaproteobacteria bacterium]|nr:HPr kinase/phosphatase C-terminal domain-containing protein [Alphaproteobacteria bacterium]MBQ8678123.1 HPr kinase/phosphatase C-terminal domain-containing protein [Alphaproteobacteria bacterium]